MAGACSHAVPAFPSSRSPVVATRVKKLAAGANSITSNARSGARKARKGAYRLILAVTSGARSATAEGKLRLR